jgi:hypothetical protein
MENTQKELSFDDALQNKGEFYKFEENKRVKIAIKNWKLILVERTDLNDKTKKVQVPEFQADVVLEEGNEVNKRLGILSKRFMANIRPFVEKKDPTKPVYLSIKKIGKDNATNYDIESFEPGL